MHILQKQYIFKPVTLQFLWTAIQTLHAINTRLKPKRNSICVMEQDWVRSYEDQINSPQSCINEWNEMSDILVKVKQSSVMFVFIKFPCRVTGLSRRMS